MTTSLFALGYMGLFFGIIAFLVWLRKRARQDRAPFPENTRLLRGPGESLRRKVADLEELITQTLVLGLLLPLAALGLGLFLAAQLQGLPQLLVVGLGVVALVVLLVVMARRVTTILARRNNTALGAFGERIVAEHLEPLKTTGHHVFHDVPAGDAPAGSTTAPFNLDHVVVGPGGVFAIETKTRRKGRTRVGFMAHEIIYDGRALAYPWGEDQHGLDQARRQAEWLAAHLHRQLGRPVPVRPILVFPGWMIIRKGSGPVTVLNPKELPSAIHTRGAEPVLDAAMIDLISRQLDTRCRDVEL